MLTCVPPHNLVLFTDRAFQHHTILSVIRDHWHRPCAEPPDLAQAFEEVEGVDALLVGEIDNAVEAVVLDELERGIHLVRPEAERVIGGVELVAASDVAVHDGGAP